MLFDIVQPHSSGNSVEDNAYLLLTTTTDDNDKITFSLIRHLGSEADTVDRREFLDSFSTIDTTAENLAVSLMKAANTIAINTRRGAGNYIFHHIDDTVPDWFKNNFDNNIFACDYLKPNEYFVTYISTSHSTIDRGWIVLQNGKILKNSHWTAYGCMVRVIE